MRERAITTSIIWIALAASIDRILASIQEATTAPWQVGGGFLILVLIIGATIATGVIWQGASQNTNAQARQEAEKAKRDNRDARIRRLLSTMDDEELDALEQERLNESDGERLSLEALMRKRG